MPRLQTSGTDCCGLVSLSGFFGTHKDTDCLQAVKLFKSLYVLDVNQPHGETDEYDLDSLMDAVDKVWPRGLSMIAVLNSGQYMLKDQYWHKRLLKHGFKLTRKFKNPTGGVCYVYLRIPECNRLNVRGD